MENSEQTTTLDALDASLQDLMKAAARVTGEPLNKGGDGVSIDNSGTQGSDGKQGGGQGSMSDAGKVEDLMIGKLTAAGFNAAAASSIVGMMKEASGGSFFSHMRPTPSGGKGGGGEMKGKAKPPVPPFAGAADGDFGGDDEDDSDDEEDEDEDAQAGGPAMRGKKKFGKSASFDEQFRQDPDIGEVVDVSPFMESLTARTTEALDTINKSLRKSGKRTDAQFVALAKVVVDLGQLAKSQQGTIHELGRRLGIVEKQPAVAPKGATSLSGAQALAKSLPNEVGSGDGSSLKKSEVASVLSYMNIEKSMHTICGHKTSTLVGNVESNGDVPAQVLAEVSAFLRRNPGEANLAKSYT